MLLFQIMFVHGTSVYHEFFYYVSAKLMLVVTAK